MSLLRCMFGPRLYRITAPDGHGRIYEANVAERWSDQVIRTISWLCSIGVYSSPIIAFVLHRRGYFVSDGLYTIYKLVSVVALIFVSCVSIRGVARFMNSDYKHFIRSLDKFRDNVNDAELKKQICQNDFEFLAWPVEYRMRGRGNVVALKSALSFSGIFTFPISIIGYVFSHTIGCKLVYPGSIGLLQGAMKPMLLQGRIKLLSNGGVRSKLLSSDGNEIDVMFVDRRKDSRFPNGNKLVICTEGNAGFYEVGIMSTALDAGYSVLGWNHPGFGGSTGVPFPNQERNAIDVVMQYSIEKLEFQPSSIVLFAWSIGGFAASWAAVTYPDVYAVVLDATFDDLEPLAISKMPSKLSWLVSRTIRENMNLNVSEQICKYNGRVLFIRRTQDEMIATEYPPTVHSNRANNLVFNFLEFRFPQLVDSNTRNVLMKWLSSDETQQHLLWNELSVKEDECLSIVRNHFYSNSPLSYPTTLGEHLSQDMKSRLAVFLVRKYLIDYDATHCTQLPSSLFFNAWDPLDGSVDNKTPNGPKQNHIPS